MDEPGGMMNWSSQRVEHDSSGPSMHIDQIRWGMKQIILDYVFTKAAIVSAIDLYLQFI